MRARVIYANISYDNNENRVCTRSGYHPYNISLFSSLVAHHGEDGVL